MFHLMRRIIRGNFLLVLVLLGSAFPGSTSPTAAQVPPPAVATLTGTAYRLVDQTIVDSVVVDETEVHAVTLGGGLGPGDADCNGDVNSIDALLVLQLDAALIDSVACPLRADVKGDGEIDSRDAAMILGIDAGLCCLWLD